jgi:hypothetical protein
MAEIWHWLMDFIGVNNTYNDFSTHMYNFWSGFGGGIIQFSLLGALIAIYHKYATHLKHLESALRKPIDKIETRIEEKRTNHDQ